MTPINKIQSHIKTLAEHALNIVLPYRCPVTGDIVGDQGALSPEIWAQLQFITDPFCQRCGYPFDYEGDADQICDQCANGPPVYNLARSAIMYNDGAKPLILGFKHADKLHAAPTLSRMMLSAASDVWQSADILVPVPLHYWRLVKRRYNQSAILSDMLAKQLGIKSDKNIWG